MDKNKFLAVVAAIALVAGCCLAMIVYPLIKGEDIFNPAPTPEQVSRSFLTALQQGDYEEAFSLCDAALQNELVSPGNFQRLIEEYGIQPLAWELSSPTITGGRAAFSGRVTFQQELPGTFQITLVSSEKEWKITSFYFDYN